MVDLRRLEAEDVPQVLEVQKDAYREELLESGDTFTRILAVFPSGCLGVFVDGELLAYVFSHPWQAS